MLAVSRHLIVAGSAEAFLLVLHGDAQAWWMAGGFCVPVLAGNIVGGTALFALIAYAQVMQELEKPLPERPAAKAIPYPVSRANSGDTVSGL
jgi:formate/nitrite transporter FocA (FNT family)